MAAANPELEGAVEELASRLSALEQLQSRVDDLAGKLEEAPTAPAGIDEELRRELEERIAELTRSVDEKLATTGSLPARRRTARPSRRTWSASG